jgi:hypothetical protein
MLLGNKVIICKEQSFKTHLIPYVFLWKRPFLHTVNTKQTCLNTVDIPLQELTCPVLPEALERMTQEIAHVLMYRSTIPDDLT